MRIAILGTRGIPARYGGFETFAENLALNLARRGHTVTVYARRRFFEQKEQAAQIHPAISVCRTPTIFHKYLETPLAGLTSFLHLAFHRADAAIVCNAANAPFSWILNLARCKFVLNVDGIERERGKWNKLGRLWYQLGEKCAVLFANKIVADAEVIAEYYRKTYKIKPITITYGAQAIRLEPGETLCKFKLSPRQYILYVSRLEPENNALGVIQAYKQVVTDLPLVIVGDAPYATQYKEELKAAAALDSRVVLTGFQFGDAYQELQSNCMLYLQATEVGGTHPALIEAMAYGNAIIANGTPENIEVLADAGLIYPKNNFAELAVTINALLNDPLKVENLRASAAKRARAEYSWDSVTERYLSLLGTL